MPRPFSLDALRRWPDVDARELRASDAADRLLLDESSEARRAAPAGTVVVIGDGYGALTLGAADDGATGIRVHQDPLSGERALAANASQFGVENVFRSLPLGPELVAGARVVLLRLPRALDALDDVSALVAAHADRDVIVYAGGMLKHMSTAMNEVLLRSFARLDVSHARQKARVLTAREPLDGREPGAREPAPALRPRVLPHAVPGLDDELVVCAFGGAFAGAGVDIGTRFLLEQLLDAAPPPSGDIIDFACGTGVIATWLALRHPERRIVASDQSASAVASAEATAKANGVGDRVHVVRDLGLEARPDATASFVALNPPFHAGAAVPGGVAEPLFAEAGRVLAPGGQLWAVWNSPQRYRPALERLVGPTRQVARNAKFTVTVSTRP
ncbi:class I SAM-dependent methyltransferase [Micromonospora sp. DT81.3]|uniref:class I SAM-dependent methyltransferase n=1 Tax=Micromonospora sp. DT81.3 TaxID=3416523 RepID=UPI003CEA10B1